MRRRLPLILAAIAALLVGGVAWLVVQPARGRDVSAVVFFAGLAGIVALMGARRVFGDGDEPQIGWSLECPPALGAVTVGALLAKLGDVGYRLEAREVDEVGASRGAADSGRPLRALSLQLSDARLKPQGGGVSVRLAEGEYGFVEAYRPAGDEQMELAVFVIAALAELAPGLGCKRADSALGFDDAALLGSTVPDRPRALEGR